MNGRLLVAMLVVALGMGVLAAAPSSAAPPPPPPPGAVVPATSVVPAKCFFFIIACAGPKVLKAAAEGILGQLSEWVGDGAGWLLRQVIAAMDSTTRVDLGTGWFKEHYRFMVGAGGLLLLPLFLLAILQGLMRQDWTMMARAAFVYLPGAMILTAVAIAATQALLATTDALSAELADGIAADAAKLGGTFATLFVAGAAATPVPIFVSFLLGIVMALATLAVWVELILRAGAIYIAAMFLPLFLATSVWPATQRWVRRLVEVLVALILSKLAIVAILSLGLSAVTSVDSVGAVLAGLAMFLLAAFAPFALLSLLPLAGDLVQHQRDSRHGLATATGGSMAWQAARSRMMTGRESASIGNASAGVGAAGAAGGAGGASGALGYRPGGSTSGRGQGARIGSVPGATRTQGSATPTAAIGGRSTNTPEPPAAARAASAGMPPSTGGVGEPPRSEQARAGEEISDGAPSASAGPVPPTITTRDAPVPAGQPTTPEADGPAPAGRPARPDADGPAPVPADVTQRRGEGSPPLAPPPEASPVGSSRAASPTTPRSAPIPVSPAPPSRGSTHPASTPTAPAPMATPLGHAPRTPVAAPARPGAPPVAPPGPSPAVDPPQAPRPSPPTFEEDPRVP